MFWSRNFILRHSNFTVELKKYFWHHFNVLDFRSQPRAAKIHCLKVVLGEVSDNFFTLLVKVFLIAIAYEGFSIKNMTIDLINSYLLVKQILLLKINIVMFIILIWTLKEGFVLRINVVLSNLLIFNIKRWHIKFFLNRF